MRMYILFYALYRIFEAVFSIYGVEKQSNIKKAKHKMNSKREGGSKQPALLRIPQFWTDR